MSSDSWRGWRTSSDSGTGVAARFVLIVIRAYSRAISPLFPSSCIYTPTCSRYARVAIERFGLLRGGLISLKRVLRCHPFRRGGYDPVPDEWKDRR